ncbi:hypothetical protein ABH941_001233 [Streptacidiphilus sp. EB103A]
MAGRSGSLQGLVLQKAVLVSLLLLVAGSWLFVVTTSVSQGPKLQQWVALIGGTLVQTGAIALIIDYVNMRSYATGEVVEAILSSEDFLRTLSGEEQIAHVRRALHARFRGDDGVDRAVEWLTVTLAAPARIRYAAKLTLLQEQITELFPDGEVLVPDSVLRVRAEFAYTTSGNLSRRPELINGDGVIHTQIIPIPRTTELTRRFQAGELHSSEAREAWVRHVLQPKVWVKLGQGDEAEIRPFVPRTRLSEAANGTVWLDFDITCDAYVQPGQQVSVVYSHRQLCHRRDSYVWRASARTYDFTFNARGFQEYRLLPIATPARDSDLTELEVLRDEIRCTGLILPESMFAFAWSPRVDSESPTL